MDTELFMECEEEELEPWQQVDDSVEEDDMDFMDNYCEPVEDSLSPSPPSETRPPSNPPSSTPIPTACSPAQIITPSTVPPPLPSSSTVSRLPSPSTPAVSAPPLMAQGPPLFLTQTAGGTFLLPAAPGSGNAQPILLTTQGFPVMNHGTPLLLNLQPGQTVQPLTLIQSPSLGQLVRPSVGMSPILPQGQAVQARTAPAPARGPAQPGPAFTAMQLPTTLTIRTSTPGPVNLQMTHVGGAGSMKLANSPALPLGSANGVSRVSAFPSVAPGSAPSLVTTSRISSTPASDPPRVVMSVEEFYYGTFEGDLSLRKPHPLGIKTSTFNCQICGHLAQNNLRLMQHMLQHSELVTGESDDGRKCCKFCYRQFSSPAQLKTHQDQVHGATLSSCMCRICEWAFENEPAFLNHMKSNHKPGEMPYVCQVCSYRSSFYSDILQHFTSFHRESRFLLCLFCLKVTRNPVNFQQHLLRHQVNQAFHCNRCRLQFVFLKEKMQHKLENHRSFRRPAKLEGLPPGSKVTIRTYGKIRPATTSAGNWLLQSSSPLVQPINIKTEHQKSLIQKSPRSPTKKLVSRRGNFSSSSTEDERLVCVECGTDASDFSAHYPTYVHCLLCPYSSCCSRAYAAHMIHHHVPASKNKVVPLHRLPPPCVFMLQCSDCDFSPRSADQMAEHLLLNPDHDSAICRARSYTEPDIQFIEEQPLSVEKEPGWNQDLPDPSWKSADCWKNPAESESEKPLIVPFTHTSGPRHNLARNSDAIDFFNLLFPAALVELIANETNAHVKTSQYMGYSCPGWVPVTTHEIKGFIGLVILMGIQNLPDPTHYWSWNHYDNSYTFYRAMSYKRFKQIAANIRMGSFINEELRGTSKPSDSLHIFRPMLDMLGRAMWNTYEANSCLTIDRALLPSLEEESCNTKGNPKTQPQVWLLCDSKSGYCHRFFIQVGEKMGQEPGFTVVPELVKDLEDKHHQLYLANSLTSVPLMQKLLDQGIYASSSFPAQNPILPRELWEEGQLENAGDFLQRHFGPLLATRWKDTKEMGCLSTNAAPGEPDTVWRRSQTKVGGLDPIDRPMAFRLLQENMRGVDICKQLLACNPLGGIPLDRHWRGLFWFLVNLSIVNAFIVLRESRKENPPAWVQDGLFTQVNFRKRLGNQLAKCAQKYFETMEIACSRAMKTEAAEEQSKNKLRHRIAKISSISKRCKNCNLKNIRHESVYGCIICKANLCKQPSCFWEFHGLSPLNKGSTKLGFIKDAVSGAIEFVEAKDSADDPMAPLDDFDFSDSERLDDLDDEEAEDIEDEVLKDDKNVLSHPPSTINSHTKPETALSALKEREDSLTARQLRVTLSALCDGLCQASRVFSTEIQLIRSWAKEARKRLKQTEQEQKVHTEGEDRMVAWVLSMREQQLPITESNLFHKASNLKKKGVFRDSFRISYDWAVSFMLRYRLGVQSIGRAATFARSLPLSLDAKISTFRDFTQKVFQDKKLSERTVAVMDELCLFLDLRSVQDKSHRADALELTGSHPLVTVYLTVLADGTMLPSLVLANRQSAEKDLPEFVLLEAGSENLLVEEALDLWTNKVWLQHLSSLTEPTKSMLVLDRHREHMGDSFLASISGAGTLPAVIPAGCSFSLQPLEVCMKPILLQHLLSRWRKFVTESPKELEEMSANQLQANISELLVDWLVAALTKINQLTSLWKKSFQLTDLLPGRNEEMEEDKASQKPEEIQLDLFKSLAETLLGAEALKANSLEVLELEDMGKEEEEEEEEEEQETEKGQDQENRQEILKNQENQEREGNEIKENRKDSGEEMREDKGKETKEKGYTEAPEKREKETNKDVGRENKEADEDRTEKTGELEEDSKGEVKGTEEDSEEEGKEIEEDSKELSKERRETRIVIGEEVGDEWKITVKSRTEGVEADGEDDDKMEES